MGNAAAPQLVHGRAIAVQEREVLGLLLGHLPGALAPSRSR